MATAVGASTQQPSSRDVLPGVESGSPATIKSNKSHGPRSKKPNYAQIHARPLPLDVYPLPVFLPHNPLSIIRIAIALISHTLWPRTSHSVVHKAYFSPETHSLHVTDHQSIRALWEHGFWGSGSLSRSDPQWLDQEKRKRGIDALKTSAEVTQKRREERRQFKLERARAQREAIEQQQLREKGELDTTTSTDDVATNGKLTDGPNGTLGPDNGSEDETAIQTAITEPPPETTPESMQLETKVNLEAISDIQDQEHLQLTPEEAFFLTYSLGSLQVYRDETLLPTSYLFRLYCLYSTFPIVEDAELHLYSLYRLRERLPKLALGGSKITPIAPDNPFLLRYAAYHHFRSLGWVARHGIKFACDFLLYQRGPVFAHAKFAVLILPSYSHPYWSESDERKVEVKAKESRDWWWLHRVNRVQTQSLKTLMLVYVEVPPPWDESFQKGGFEVDIGAALKKYKVREFVIRRWTPNRNRD